MNSVIYLTYSRQLAQAYSYAHASMRSPEIPCDSEIFEDGITNGANW